MSKINNERKKDCLMTNALDVFPRVAAGGAVRGHVTAGPTPLPGWKTPHLTGSKIKNSNRAV